MQQTTLLHVQSSSENMQLMAVAIKAMCIQISCGSPYSKAKSGNSIKSSVAESIKGHVKKQIADQEHF